MAATMDKILYFCNVKSQRRHDVAAKGSVFCVINLLEESERIECGSSNAHKVSAFENLTTRNALFYVKKSKV